MSQHTPCIYKEAGEGALRAPFEPPASRVPAGPTGGGCPPDPLAGALMADRRTAQLNLRVSQAELSAWRAKAQAAGVPLSDLLRRAMARTRTWSAAAAEVERDRTRQIARIGNNLNQIARWANTHASSIDAVEIIANLVYISETLDKLARVGGEADDAH